MILHWSYLSDALKPRVLWIVVHHLELPSANDDVWGYLKRGLLDVLMVRPVELEVRQQKEQASMAAEGFIAAQVQQVTSRLS